MLSTLQPLAYLRKYPHVRQVFYQQRTSFHPAAPTLRPQATTSTPQQAAPPTVEPSSRGTSSRSTGFFMALANRSGKERRALLRSLISLPVAAPTTPRQTDMFSLVERFTFRPSSHEYNLPNLPPMLLPEIQYWVGVIMRNACRKNDSRGGIRQCANGA